MTDSYHMGFKDGQQSLIDQGYEKIRHGRWVMNERGVYECSICGRVPTAEQKQYDRYCSWCGAKMDEGDK